MAQKFPYWEWSAKQRWKMTKWGCTRCEQGLQQACGSQRGRELTEKLDFDWESMNRPAWCQSHIMPLWLSACNNHGRDVTPDYKPRLQQQQSVCFSVTCWRFHPRCEQFWALSKKASDLSSVKFITAAANNAKHWHDQSLSDSSVRVWCHRITRKPLQTVATRTSYSSCLYIRLVDDALSCLDGRRSHNHRQSRPLFVSLNTKWHVGPFSLSENIPSTYTLIVHAPAVRLWLSGHIWQPAIESESAQGHRTSRKLSAAEEPGLLLPSKWHVHHQHAGKPPV